MYNGKTAPKIFPEIRNTFAKNALLASIFRKKKQCYLCNSCFVIILLVFMNGPLSNVFLRAWLITYLPLKSTIVCVDFNIIFSRSIKYFAFVVGITIYIVAEQKLCHFFSTVVCVSCARLCPEWLLASFNVKFPSVRTKK